ncbi:lytic transglycosylase domain-containing protein, partial [Escherichia coli]|nr:lytic transglycosylase domain-containing protein [Escherichia coli]
MMTIYMYWPQVVWAVLVLLGLGSELARHGQVRTGKHSFWWRLFGSVTVAWLLWCGGFF